MTKGNRKYGSNTGSRSADGKFGPGNAGKPLGARHRATVAAEALLDGEAENVTRRCIEAALDGDATAMRLVMERIIPARKGRPVEFKLPQMTNTGDLRAAALAIIGAVASGDLTPEEGAVISSLIKAARDAVETDELARRLDALEQARRSVRASVAEKPVTSTPSRRSQSAIQSSGRSYEQTSGVWPPC